MGVLNTQIKAQNDSSLLSLRPLVFPLSFWLISSCLRLKFPKKTSKYKNKWNRMLKHLICHFCFRIFQQLPHFSAVYGFIFKSKARITINGISAMQETVKSWGKMARTMQEWTLQQIHISCNLNYHDSTTPNLSSLDNFSVLKYISCWSSCRWPHRGHMGP